MAAANSSYQQQQPPKQYLMNNVPRTIHILGTGSIGKLVAHSLRSLPDPPPVTLLLHRPTLIHDFKAGNETIQLTTSGVTESSSGCEFELSLPVREDLNSRFYTPNAAKVEDEYQPYISNGTISNLIVCVKGHQTVSALGSIAHRLNADSTICFMQNGMGIVEEVNEALFPDLEVRPDYMLGVNSHGVFTKGTFSAEHAGKGAIYLGMLPRESTPKTSKKARPAPSRHILRTLTSSPVLGAVGLNPSELLQAQLEKLAVNCIINPITVLLDSHNGSVLHNHALTRTMRLLLSEICLVIQNLPELQGVPNVASRFSVERLESYVVNVAEKTARNISSMLADVRRGSKTEIEYINGYIVRRGEEMGIKPVMNYLIMQLIDGKQNMISREIDNYAPFEYKLPGPGSGRGRIGDGGSSKL